MGGFLEQHVFVKFCFKLVQMLSETFERLKLAFGDKVMSRTQTHKWYKFFKKGQTLVVYGECSGQPSTPKMKKTSKNLESDSFKWSRLTIGKAADKVGISKAMCHVILTENLGIHHRAAKFLPCLLNDDHKPNRFDVSKSLSTVQMLMKTF
jgi:hypothetical protein